MASASFNSRDNSEQSDSQAIADNHAHKFYEYAGGYTKGLGELGVFELYAGGGHGFSTNRLNFFDDTLGKRDWSYNYGKYFIQPGIGLKTTFFEAGLAMRFNYLVFQEYKSDQFTHQSAENGWFVEPALTLRAGTERLKLQLQAGLSLPVNREENYFDQEFHKPFLINAGLCFRL